MRLLNLSTKLGKLKNKANAKATLNRQRSEVGVGSFDTGSEVPTCAGNLGGLRSEALRYGRKFSEPRKHPPKQHYYCKLNQGGQK